MIYLMGILTMIGFYVGPVVIIYVVGGGLMALGVTPIIAIPAGLAAVAVVLKSVTWK